MNFEVTTARDSIMPKLWTVTVRDNRSGQTMATTVWSRTDPKYTGHPAIPWAKRSLRHTPTPRTDP